MKNENGVIDLCMLPLLNGNTRPRNVVARAHVCLDGEDDWRASPGSRRFQSRPDQRRHHPATGKPERGGEAAVGVSGAQLDPPTVSHNLKIRKLCRQSSTKDTVQKKRKLFYIAGLFFFNQIKLITLDSGFILKNLYDSSKR